MGVTVCGLDSFWMSAVSAGAAIDGPDANAPHTLLALGSANGLLSSAI